MTSSIEQQLGSNDQPDFSIRSNFTKRKGETTGIFIPAIIEQTIIKSTKLNVRCTNGILDHFCQSKGLALVINNYTFGGKHDREGSQKDFADIKDLFLKTLEFDVIAHWDLTETGMMDAMINFVQFCETNKDKYSSFAVVLMTHGELGHFYGIDGQLLNENDFTKPLQRSKQLRDKPKVFLFQACRCLSSDENNPPPESLVLPVAGRESLIFHSTSPGDYSRRNERCGSRFIQNMCKNVKIHAREDYADIVYLAMAIIEEVSMIERLGKQKPVFQNKLSKILHFFPIQNVAGV